MEKDGPRGEGKRREEREGPTERRGMKKSSRMMRRKKGGERGWRGGGGGIRADLGKSLARPSRLPVDRLGLLLLLLFLRTGSHGRCDMEKACEAPTPSAVARLTDSKSIGRIAARGKNCSSLCVKSLGCNYRWTILLHGVYREGLITLLGRLAFFDPRKAFEPGGL
ncbi:hypothetical protein KM043_008220 [Ampulex compressa]|nr:hypothetical protein KM043_008220 [Ampulex compressa]